MVLKFLEMYPRIVFPILVVLQDNVPHLEMVVNLPSYEHIRIPKVHFTNSRMLPRWNSLKAGQRFVPSDPTQWIFLSAAVCCISTGEKHPPPLPSLSLGATIKRDR